MDRSGSMSGLEGDTIGGFNSLIKKSRKKAAGRMLCFNSFCLITKARFLHDRVELSQVRKMTREDYVPCGSTALIDAIGGAIHHIANIHKYARREDVPCRTMFVIITDGYENSSHIYSSDRVKAMIEKKKKREKYGWEFLFIGANIDAVETAKHFGISEDRAVDYCADGQGTAVVYDAVADTVCEMRAAMPICNDWSKKIKKDF
ncbi:MAG: hypothetical protein L6V88_12430 [Anaerotruncus sp.]|nr:MAG: hypothetical protein L6V88_12430 [Anaerotruncus sp.]